MDSKAISTNLLNSSKADKFAGYDPFDGLNSRFFDLAPSLRKTKLGLAWIQFHKRSPVNLRPLCLVPPKRNPKGVALFILGLLDDYRRTGEQSYLDEATKLGEWLLTQRSDPNVWKYACWGYHFDWNARAFFVPKGKPNVITTIYVAQSLFALGKQLERSEYVDVALDASNFIVNSLYTEDEGRQFFAYIPGETAFVHNASLWAAAWVAVAAHETNNREYEQLAIKVARQSVSEQSTDGSWVYGSRHHHQFIDGFHTGYNLEALHTIRKALNTTEFDQSIDLGLAYYRAHFFDDDGAAKYYCNNRYPLDMHSVAQAVFTLLRVGGTQEDYAQVKKTLCWSVENMYIPDKHQFVYQKTPRFNNKINYIRWTQAWVYYSLAFYNRLQAERDGTH